MSQTVLSVALCAPDSYRDSVALCATKKDRNLHRGTQRIHRDSQRKPK